MDFLFLSETRRGRAKSRALAFPASRRRAIISADGTVGLVGGPSVRLEAPPVRPRGALPVIEWQWPRQRVSLLCRAFVTQMGLFERVEISNQYREPRRVSLRATVLPPPDVTQMRLEGSTLVARGGRRLAAFGGARVTGRRIAPRRAQVDLTVIVPARHSRIVDVVVPLEGRAASPRALSRELSVSMRTWDELCDAIATTCLPDAVLQEGYRRALAALIGFVAPDESGARDWPRPGCPPEAGPGTLDAIALRALESWGASELFERCVGSVVGWQGCGAPPGEGFARAGGYLSTPPGDPIRDRWVSDCGALLWAIATRTGGPPPRAIVKELRPHIEAACDWILGERGASGVLPEGRSPTLRGRAGRAWNDGWSWRGLAAASSFLAPSYPGAGARLGSAAAEYAEAILKAWGEDPDARACLAALGMAERQRPEGGSPARRRAVFEVASELAAPFMGDEAELRAGASFLLLLRDLLLSERSGVVHVFPGAAPAWFGSGRRLEFERLPTSGGCAAARSFGAGSRTVIELVLPRTSGPCVLHTGTSAGQIIGHVRLDGKTWAKVRPRAGEVLLPRGGGHFLIEVGWKWTH